MQIIVFFFSWGGYGNVLLVYQNKITVVICWFSVFLWKQVCNSASELWLSVGSMIKVLLAWKLHLIKHSVYVCLGEPCFYDPQIRIVQCFQDPLNERWEQYHIQLEGPGLLVHLQLNLEEYLMMYFFLPVALF